MKVIENGKSCAMKSSELLLLRMCLIFEDCWADFKKRKKAANADHFSGQKIMQSMSTVA